MSNAATKIQMMAELNRKIDFYDDFGGFLVGARIVSLSDIEKINRLPVDQRAVEFYILFTRHQEQFQLVSWEWTKLPVESMRLTLVTHNCVKEFLWTE